MKKYNIKISKEKVSLESSIICVLFIYTRRIYLRKKTSSLILITRDLTFHSEYLLLPFLTSCKYYESSVAISISTCRQSRIPNNFGIKQQSCPGYPSDPLPNIFNIT